MPRCEPGIELVDGHQQTVHRHVDPIRRGGGMNGQLAPGRHQWRPPLLRFLEIVGHRVVAKDQPAVYRSAWVSIEMVDHEETRICVEDRPQVAQSSDALFILPVLRGGPSARRYGQRRATGDDHCESCNSGTERRPNTSITSFWRWMRHSAQRIGSVLRECVLRHRCRLVVHVRRPRQGPVASARAPSTSVAVAAPPSSPVSLSNSARSIRASPPP